LAMVRPRSKFDREEHEVRIDNATAIAPILTPT